MNLKLQTANHKQNTGFTLIEAMVAVTILTLAVGGPMFAASRSIVTAQLSRDQLVASHLAQESIEHMRSVRDDAYLALYPGDTRAAWANFLQNTNQCNATSNPNQACAFDPMSATAPLSACTIGSCPLLHLMPLSGGGQGYTTQQSGTATPFTRTIQRINVSPTEERIVSRVSWNFRGSLYSVTITNNLTSWQ